MKRAYLEEDLELIQSYFPGARTVALRTPFDLSQNAQRLPRLAPSGFHEVSRAPGNWTGGILWMS
jgi:hypothetical protein